jgi:predicted ATP-grasp superfamily ATP-dependent carboligase
MMKNIETELIEKYAKGRKKVRCKFILTEDVRSNTYICAAVEYPESDKEIVARVNEERRAVREIEQHKKKNETNLKKVEKEEKKLKLLPLTGGGGDYAGVSDEDIIEVEDDEDEFSDDHVIHKGSGGWHV